MDKQGQISLGIIFSIFIAVIFGIAFMNQIASTQNLVTEKQVITNETIVITGRNSSGAISQLTQYTIANPPTGWKVNDCPIEGFVLRNQSGQVMTPETDYYFTASSGLLNLTNTLVMNSTNVNNTGIDYSFCDDGYNTGASSRGVARLWTIFCALIIMAATTYGIKEWLNSK